MLLLAGVVFSSAGKGVSCSALLSVGYFKDSANILIVGAGFVKSVGAVFHPVWEQQECSGCFLVNKGRNNKRRQ